MRTSWCCASVPDWSQSKCTLLQSDDYDGEFVVVVRAFVPSFIHSKITIYFGHDDTNCYISTCMRDQNICLNFRALIWWIEWMNERPNYALPCSFQGISRSLDSLSWSAIIIYWRSSFASCSVKLSTTERLVAPCHIIRFVTMQCTMMKPLNERFCSHSLFVTTGLLKMQDFHSQCHSSPCEEVTNGKFLLLFTSKHDTYTYKHPFSVQFRA